jgi:hypothetical protein
MIEVVNIARSSSLGEFSGLTSASKLAGLRVPAQSPPPEGTGLYIYRDSIQQAILRPREFDSTFGWHNNLNIQPPGGGFDRYNFHYQYLGQYPDAAGNPNYLWSQYDSVSGNWVFSEYPAIDGEWEASYSAGSYFGSYIYQEASQGVGGWVATAESDSGSGLPILGDCLLGLLLLVG